MWQLCSICKRKLLVFNAFVDSEPLKRLENRQGMTELRSFDNSTSKYVLGVLKTIYLRIWQTVVSKLQ